MGLRDQALGSVLGGGRGDALGGGRERSPLVNILLMALAAKALQHYAAQRHAQNTAAGQSRPGLGGGLGDILGGLTGQGGGGLGGLGGLLSGLGGGAGGGLGGMLGGLAGAGGLAGLLAQFNTHGLGDIARTWVDTGQNQAIAPVDLERALGPDTLQQLSEETGLTHQALLADLSAVLPEAIDHLTPNGQLPSEAELQHLASELEAGLGAKST